MCKKYSIIHSGESFFVTERGFDTQVVGISDIEDVINSISEENEAVGAVISELEGLKNLVNYYWGGSEDDLAKIIVIAKALIEANCTKKPFARLASKLKSI